MIGDKVLILILRMYLMICILVNGVNGQEYARRHVVRELKNEAERVRMIQRNMVAL